MRNKKIKICDAIIHPGEIANLALPLPEKNSCAPLYMPIKVIHGKKKGPCLVIFSVLKGIELNGLEIAHRIGFNIDPDKIAGTVVIVPVMNVYGLTHYPSNLPSGKNLADCFPGKEDGSYGERIAHIVTHEILKKSDYCIELQTGELNHNILPQIYCNFENKRAKELAKIFQAPVITDVSVKNNSLRSTTEELDIPLLVYQAGEAMRFDEGAVICGYEGVLNVMRAIDILEKSPLKETRTIFSKDEDWILAHKGGILHSTVELGANIKKRDIIATIKDPFGVDPVESVRSPMDGIIVGINSFPLIHEGLPIFKIASFIDYDKAESVIEEWTQNQSEN
jgi:predicted deacylase